VGKEKRGRKLRGRVVDRAFQMVEGNLPGPLERAVVLCRGAATNCYVHIGMCHIKDGDECQERRMVDC
jgi:hypothetical protein